MTLSELPKVLNTDCLLVQSREKPMHCEGCTVPCYTPGNPQLELEPFGQSLSWSICQTEVAPLHPAYNSVDQRGVLIDLVVLLALPHLNQWAP